MEISIVEIRQGSYYAYDDSYSTALTLRIKNKNPLDIEAFSGTLVIYNVFGEKLVEESSRFSLIIGGNFTKGEEIIAELYVSGLDKWKGKELYFSEIGELRATFQFDKIEYTWDKEKEYKKPITKTILGP